MSQSSPLESRALHRLGSAISKQARNFVQNNLPPLRTLPTLKQYDDLTAQRKGDLSARWREEDEALAEVSRIYYFHFSYSLHLKICTTIDKR